MDPEHCLADDPQHLLPHVDHQLGLDDRVVPRAHHAHLQGEGGNKGVVNSVTEPEPRSRN